MRWGALFLLVSGVAVFDAAAEPRALLNDRALTGWTFVSPQSAKLRDVAELRNDGVLAVAGKPLGYLRSDESYANFRLHVEWRWTGAPGNSGVLVHIATGPIDRNLWPRCLQVQTKHQHAGDVLPMAGATFAEKLSTPPDAITPQLFHMARDSEKPPGEWNACDVVCRDGVLEVTMNGVRQNRVTQCVPAKGAIGFQCEGAPFELRDVTLDDGAEEIGAGR